MTGQTFRTGTAVNKKKTNQFVREMSDEHSYFDLLGVSSVYRSYDENLLRFHSKFNSVTRSKATCPFTHYTQPMCLVEIRFAILSTTRTIHKVTGIEKIFPFDCLPHMTPVMRRHQVKLSRSRVIYSP